MSSSQFHELDQLENINQMFPSIWLYVEFWRIKKYSHIELDDLKILNTYLGFIDVNELP